MSRNYSGVNVTLAAMRIVDANQSALGCTRQEARYYVLGQLETAFPDSPAIPVLREMIANDEADS